MHCLVVLAFHTTAAFFHLPWTRTFGTICSTLLVGIETTIEVYLFSCLIPGSFCKNMTDDTVIWYRILRLSFIIEERVSESLLVGATAIPWIIT